MPQSQITDAQTEIEGLKRRREIVGRARVEPEVLRGVSACRSRAFSRPASEGEREPAGAPPASET